MPDLLRTLYDRLHPTDREALKQAVMLASERSVNLHLVGGAVRDLLLDSAQLDVDLAVDGDAVALATELGKRLSGRAVSHPRFGTATVKGEGYRLDFARTRSERYIRPGALPVVSPGTLADDLARRDFTINAMAFQLTGSKVGRLIDLHGGQADLKAGRLRVLHGRSFQDDPTRIFRAVRYAGRLGFRLERDTARLLRRDLKYLGSISGARLRREFEAIAREAQVSAIISLAVKLGVLTALHPPICVSARQVTAMKQIVSGERISRIETTFFCLLLCSESGQQTEAQILRLALTGRQATAVRGCVRLRREEKGLSKVSLRPSQVVWLLRGSPPEAIDALALLADDSVVRERLKRYLAEWRFVRPRLNGRDIEALGVPHGPQVGVALDALRTARLDGLVTTRDDEVVFVEKFRARSRTARRMRGG